MEALFSENADTRERAETTICNDGFEDVADRELSEILITAVDPEVHHLYNDCVASVLANKENEARMLTCRLSAGGTPLDVNAEVLFVPTIQMASPTVTTAEITGGRVLVPSRSDGEIGAMVDAAGLGIPAEEVINPLTTEQVQAGVTLGLRPDVLPFGAGARETTLSIAGKKLFVGSHPYRIRRANQHLPVSITVQTDNGLSCSEEIDPAQLINAEIEIVPRGNFLESTSKVIMDGATGSCDGTSAATATYCVDDGVNLLTYRVDTYSANCGSFMGATGVSNANTQCIEASYQLHGCGKNFWGCKGRGWLKWRAELLGERAGDVAVLPTFVHKDRFNALLSERIQYPHPIPENIVVSHWDFTVRLQVLSFDMEQKVYIPLTVALGPESLASGGFEAFGSAGADKRSFALLIFGPRMPATDRERVKNAVDTYIANESRIREAQDFDKLINGIDETVVNPGQPWLDEAGINNLGNLTDVGIRTRVLESLENGEIALE